MRILFVITGLGMGGAEHVVSNLADELVKLGHKVKIAYLTGEVLVSPKSTELELIPIGMNSAKDFAKAYIKLRGLVKKFKPDVVHSHMFHSNILSRMLRLTIKIPILISTAHSNNEGGYFRMLSYRLTDSLVDISTNVSEEAVNSYIQKKAVKPNKIISIPNGINTEEFQFSTDAREKKRKQLSIGDKLMILCIGRLDKPKDYPNLLNSISLLKKTRQDFKVMIAGEGPLKSDLDKIVEKLELSEYIEFLGISRDIKDLMSATDVYVMSSAWEGLPMVILEAMSCKRFIVATDCGGIREVLDSNGIIVNIKDHIELSKALEKALEMSVDQRLEVGKAARQHVIKNYSLKSNVEEYLKLYNVMNSFNK